MNILITAGATREPIDAVRFISNLSTGGTGTQIADTLYGRGHSVALLCGIGSVLPRTVAGAGTFASAEDLRERLRRLLSGGGFDAVIMAAAVSDYRLQKAAVGKMDSSPESLTLRLVRNRKILPELKSLSPRPLAVVGFKLTVGADAAARRAAVAAQFASGGVDAVVHNDLEDVRRGPGHPFRIHLPAGSDPIGVDGPGPLAVALERIIGDIVRARGA